MKKMKQVRCNYCERDAALVGGDVVYPHRPDLAAKMFWHCAPCDAYVGCHQGTQTPLGRLAKADLRAAKVEAHAAFDPLWKRKRAKDGISKGKARGKGYAWLAKQLGIEKKDCHIGMFDVATCKRVVEVCTPFVRPNCGERR